MQSEQSHTFMTAVSDLSSGSQSLQLFLLFLTITGCLLLFLIVLLVRHRAQGRQLKGLTSELVEAEVKIHDLDQLTIEHRLRIVELETLLANERKNGGEKLTLLEEARDELRLQFSALAQQIFEEKSEKFGSQNKERLEAILQPFHDQLTSFKKEINDIYLSDTRERISLKEEILHLRDLNQQISTEAINLTRALKGDKKNPGQLGRAGPGEGARTVRSAPRP